MIRLAYRALARLLPTPFRARHGVALEATFVEQIDAARARGGRLRAAWMGVTEFSDLIRCILDLRFGFPTARDRVRRPQPPDPRLGSRVVASFRQDLLFALRTYRRQPAFTLSAVLLLALGIAANTVAFTLVNGYLLQPLPFAESDRLVQVGALPDDAPMAAWRELPDDLWQMPWPAQDSVIEHLVAWDRDAFTLVDQEPAQVVPGAWVTAGYFGALGMSPYLGRLIQPEDNVDGAPAVAVISHSLWRSRFGQAPDIVGARVRAYSSDRPDEAETFTVVGVLPADFWFMNSSTQMLTAIKGTRFPSLVRLHEGISPARAQQHFADLVGARVGGLPTDWRPVVRSAHAEYVSEVRPAILTLLAAVDLVLLIACANVAILLMIRAVARVGEITVRRALGASRSRLVRQLLTEGVLLAGLSALLGLWLASMSLGAFAALIEQQIGRPVPGGLDRLALDTTVIAWTLAVSALTGILFATIPAWMSSGGDLTRALKTSGRGASEATRPQFTRNLLIGAEVALSLALLVGATLMVRTALNLQRTDLGFEASGVYTAHVSIRQRTYPEPADRVAFVERMLAGLRAGGGVHEAGMLAGWPFAGAMGSAAVLADTPEPREGPETGRYIVAGDYFAALRIPVLEGRSFDGGDVAGAEPVVVIGERLARAMWPEGGAVGQRIRPANEPEGWRRVIGVVGNVRESVAGESAPALYVPFAQDPFPFLFVMAKVNAPAASITARLAEVVADLDPTAAVTRVAMLPELVDREIARPRFLASLLTGFGLFALALAAFGLQAMVAFAVRQRRQEVAVRMALGASGVRIVSMFLQQATLVIGAGVFAGLGLAWILARVLQSQLHGVAATSLSSFAGAALVLGAVGVLAVWWSARVAAGTDPASSLRSA